MPNPSSTSSRILQNQLLSKILSYLRPTSYQEQKAAFHGEFASRVHFKKQPPAMARSWDSANSPVSAGGRAQDCLPKRQRARRHGDGNRQLVAAWIPRLGQAAASLSRRCQHVRSSRCRMTPSAASSSGACASHCHLKPEPFWLKFKLALPELPHGLAVPRGVGAGEMGVRTRGGDRAHGGPAPAHLQGGASPHGFRVRGGRPPLLPAWLGATVFVLGLVWLGRAHGRVLRPAVAAVPAGSGGAGPTASLAHSGAGSPRLRSRRRACGAAWPAKRGCRWRSSCATSSARLRQPGRRERLPQEACDSNGTNPPPTGGDVHHACRLQTGRGGRAAHKSPCGIACSWPVVGAP